MRSGRLLDAHDLAVVGAHVGLDRLGDGFDATLDDLETLGCRYAIVPSLPPERRGGRDVGRWLGETLNGLAERASTRGIRIGYHNHDFEFAGSPGDRLWDGLLETVGSSVRLELDVCWARVAGEDPAALISALPGRIGSLHLKDVDADLRTPRIPPVQACCRGARSSMRAMPPGSSGSSSRRTNRPTRWKRPSSGWTSSGGWRRRSPGRATHAAGAPMAEVHPVRPVTKEPPARPLARAGSAVPLLFRAPGGSSDG